MNALLENMQVDVGIQTNTTSSSIYTQSFSMKGYSRAAAVLVVGAITATGGIVQAQLMGGDSTTAPSGMSSITNATIAVGTSSTSGKVYNAHKVRIICNSDTGTVCATGTKLTIKGQEFIVGSTAGSSTAVYTIGGSSVSSAICKSLTTTINRVFATSYHATYSATGTTAAICDIELINIQATTTGLSVIATAQATIAGFMVASLKSQGILSFPVARLMATASSFTNFCIRLNTTAASSIPCGVTIFRDPIMSPQNLGAGHKRDLSTSALI